MHNTRKKERIADGAAVVLGTLLFVSPWIIGCTDEINASWDAWLGGLAVATLGLSALALYAEWKIWRTSRWEFGPDWRRGSLRSIPARPRLRFITQAGAQ